MHHWSSIWRRISTGFRWFVISLFAFWYLLHWWPGLEFGLLILVDALLPWLSLGLAFTLVLSFLSSDRFHQLLTTTALSLTFLLFMPLYLPRFEPAPPTNGLLTVMSHNLWKSNPNRKIERIAALIAQERPDILLLQEAEQEGLTDLEQALIPVYGQNKLYIAFEPTISQAVVSHYPLKTVGMERERTRLQMVVAETPHDDVHIWNIHAYRANFLPFGPNFLSYGSDYEEHQKYQGQYAWLADQLISVDSPLIIAGDFNMSYLSTPFRTLTEKLQSAHREAGWGLGLTFPATADHGRWFSLWGRPYRISSPIRLVRIDDILANSHFYVEEATTLQDNAGSDHAPIVAQLRWREGGE